MKINFGGKTVERSDRLERKIKETVYRRLPKEEAEIVLKARQQAKKDLKEGKIKF